jgi:hypothetical protein
MMVPALVAALLQAAAVWDAADLATRRLSPDAFTELPAVVRAEAKKRGCTMPQTKDDEPGQDGSQPHNVIRGRFRGPEVDWAILCSRDRVSAILVCHASAPLRCEELAESPDRDWLQVIDGKGGIGFSRGLATMPRGSTLDEVSLPRDGIEDAFHGKASVVWSWQDGHWRQIPWAD